MVLLYNLILILGFVVVSPRETWLILKRVLLALLIPYTTNKQLSIDSFGKINIVGFNRINRDILSPRAFPSTLNHSRINSLSPQL